LVHFYSKFLSFACSNRGTAKQIEPTGAAPRSAPAHAPPEAARRPSARAFPRPSRAPRSSMSKPRHAPTRHPRRTTAKRARTAQRSVHVPPPSCAILRPAFVSRRHARRQAAYLNAAPPPPRVRTPSQSAAIAAPRQARPPASMPGPQTILISSLGPIEACVVIHCSALRLSRRCHSPPRLPPPASAACPRRSRLRADQPLQSTLGEPLGGLAPLDGQGRLAIAAGEPTRRREGICVRIGIFSRA
jgi:hypothetical protein